MIPATYHLGCSKACAIWRLEKGNSLVDTVLCCRFSTAHRPIAMWVYSRVEVKTNLALSKEYNMVALYLTKESVNITLDIIHHFSNRS